MGDSALQMSHPNLTGAVVLLAFLAVYVIGIRWVILGLRRLFGLSQERQELADRYPIAHNRRVFRCSGYRASGHQRRCFVIALGAK